MTAIACRITAISASDRSKYLEYRRCIRQSVVSPNELATGYDNKLVSDTLSDDEFQAALEALRCPFLEVRPGERYAAIARAPVLMTSRH